LDQRWITPRVLYGEELGLKSADVKTFASITGATVVVNANYFDERGRPLGLLKTARSRPHTSLSKSSLFTGIFGIRNSLAFITHRDELALDGGEEAVQAGPLLLRSGVPLAITRGAGRQSRRSLIGLDKDQKMIIAVTDSFVGGLTWVELQELFDGQAGVVPTLELLNLDGGGSSQLYVKGPPIEQHVPGATTVPVALGFFPKQNP
jgi:exopolysaccharide biosynthesis protein